MGKLHRVALVLSGVLGSSASACACQTGTLAELVTAAEGYRHQYYNLGRSEIDDSEFDALVDYIATLSECREANRLGVAVAGHAAAEPRTIPMLSLTAVETQQEVQAYIGSLADRQPPELLLQPKIDGLALELRYESGQLFSATTRGDGYRGVDVTEVVRRALLAPVRLPDDVPGVVTVRGEVYVPESRYAHMESRYQTARDLAAATILSQHAAPELLASLRFYPIDWLEADKDSDWDALTQLARWGFEDATLVSLRAFDVRSVSEYFHSRPWRSRLDAATDGIVIKLASRELRRRLGQSAQAPHWAIAWKYRLPAQLAEVRQILYQIGRTGQITPVLEIAPVQFPGRTVTRLNGHSPQWLQQQGVGIGSKLTVRLAGGTTPVIGSVLSSATRKAFPAPPQVYPGLCVRSTPLCEQRFMMQLQRLIAPQGLAIDELDTSHLEHLVDAGVITQLSDLYRLTPAQLQRQGFSPIQSRQLVEQIARSRALPLERQLYALGIPGMGLMTIKRVASHWSHWKPLLEAGEAEWQQLLGKRGTEIWQALQQVELARQLDLLMPVWEG